MFRLSLAAARVNANLTQRQVASALNVSTRTVWQWENGITQPKPTMIDALCKLYGVHYDMLIFFDNKNA